MIIAGIDPGKDGGIAFVENGHTIVAGLRMPKAIVNKKTLVNARQLFEWAMSQQPAERCVVEWVHAMPGQGVTSCFSFGRSTGAAEAIAMLLAPVQWVPPQTWKKHFSLKGSDKQASIEKAKNRFGDSYVWKHKIDNGIAEAALMAAWWHDTQAPILEG